MNFKLTTSNIKGKEDVSITLAPSNNLEREYFNSLFSGEVVFTSIKDEILISRKQDTVLEEIEMPILKDKNKKEVLNF